MRGAAGRNGTGVLTLVAALAAGGCSVPVVAGLDESDASQAVVALEQNGLASEKDRDPDKEGAFRVVVAREDATAALAALAEEGLPARPTSAAVAAPGRGSLVPSRLSEQAQLVAGTSDALERSLRGLDGVLSARVHLGVPTQDPLAIEAQPRPATASVLLRHRGSTPPLPAGDVQRLVAGAVPGLGVEQVTVVMTPAPARARSGDQKLARLGPLTVTRSSLLGLRALIGVAVLVNAALLACVLGLWARLRRAERSLSDGRPSEPERAPRAAR